MKELLEIQPEYTENQDPKIKNGFSHLTEHENGLTWPRLFGEGDPYSLIRWERRTAKITKHTGEIVFEQKDVEVPDFWSQTATDIVASKYFRGRLGFPEREWSARQMVDRVAGTIAQWGYKDGYFATEEDYRNFRNDLCYILINQYAAFNSPVWFNVGVQERPQCSACFILSVQDTMPSILEWYRQEGVIFKGGSGSGINLSSLRGSKEALSKGGHSSGPVSFMKGADGVANSIKSGGTTRRAAKMVVLNVDHPDIKSFIYCKKEIEDITKVLERAGIKSSIEGDLFNPYTLLPFQNANNSVRVTDEFMKAVENDDWWDLKAVTTGETIDTIKAREIMEWIADAAWHSADPGMQYDTVINDWHTCSNTGRINASNPCFTGDTFVYTNKGLIQFKELYEKFNKGEKIKVYTHNKTNKNPENTISLTNPTRVITTGVNPVYKMIFSNGLEIKVTENHKFWTENKGWIRAKDLTSLDKVMLLDQEILFDGSDLGITVNLEKIYKSGWGGRHTKEFKKIDLPSVWTSPFAEYVGYMVGDGSLVEAKDAQHRLSTASVIFGAREEADELLPRFDSIIEEMGIQSQIVAMPNGTVQLRVNRTPFVRFMKEIGVEDERAHLKRVPSSIFKTPKHIIAGFLRGLFSADGCVYNGTDSRYVGLGSVSKELLLETQQLLLSFGIFSRIYPIKKEPKSKFSYIKEDGTIMHYDSKPIYDLRIAGPSISIFKEKIGFLLSSKQERLDKLLKGHEFYKAKNKYIYLKEKEYLGEELTYNLTEPRNHSYLTNGIVVANCSEYMHLDDSACNLASINLLKFLKTDCKFNVELYKKAIDTIITAQDIIVDNSSYPTEKITKNSENFRELGLGYANLGSLIMTLGFAYDSDQGRAICGTLTSILTGEAYLQSSKLAVIKGSFQGYAENQEPMLGVLRKHLDCAEKLYSNIYERNLYDDSELIEESRAIWHGAVQLAENYGVRNSQATVLAPTGTIAFLMDCATTGIEPELALVKYKKLVGGGTLKLVNNQVGVALARLGYNESEIREITNYILEKETIEGAPGLKPEHQEVFDCSFKPANGERSIHYMGHLRMMGAAQPFISGAISKTVNLPNSATVKEIHDAFIEAWKLGIKAVAFYRDGSKTLQPLNTKKEELIERVNGYTRVKLPEERPSVTHKFSVAGHEGYLTVGMYPDSRKPGETFITIAKEGSTVSGLFDVIATLISVSLQSGVPLKTLVKKFKDLRFEPSGATSNNDIPFAKSIIDYIFKYLGGKFLSEEEKTEIFGTHENKENGFSTVTLASTTSDSIIMKVADSDAPVCECGTIMMKAGSCYSCPNCFAITGVCN